MKRFLICDDHALVREALAGTVRLSWPDAEILEARDFPAAWSAATTHPLDIILVDLVMPGAGPVAGINGVMNAAPDTPVLVITGTEDDGLMLELIDRGVAGFAPKTASGSIIEAAIRLILAGGRYLPPRLADIAAARLTSGEVTPKRDEAATIPKLLTDRQRAVLKLMAEGRSNKEIAKALDVAPSTVKTHLSQIMMCLGTSNRMEASIKARMLKLV